jgi:hypothetical protein
LTATGNLLRLLRPTLLADEEPFALLQVDEAASRLDSHVRTSL